MRYFNCAQKFFVVEQDCVYQDLDGKDQKAIHILGYEKDQLVAYTRIFKPGDYFEQFSIGRVVVSPQHRGKFYGQEIMKASLAFAKAKLNETKMDIIKDANEWLGSSMSNMSTSDRVHSSRKAKELILGINEVYKETKDEELMDLMKLLTAKKQKIEKRLKGIRT